jgi:hypothetical protein
MTRATPAVLIACTALLALAGCTPDRRTPRNVAGTWVQVELNGQPLPARFETQIREQVCVSEMVRNEMRLNEDGSYATSGEVRSGCGPAAESVALKSSPITDLGSYRLEGEKGDTIRMETPALAAMNASSRPVVVGVFKGSELVITLTDPVTGATQTARHVKE